jgi:ribonuclease R
MVVGADGRKKRHSFHRILMRSAAKLAYQQAQAAIDGRPDDTTGPLLEPVLRPLWAAYQAVRRARDVREPLNLDLPERKIILKPDGTVDRVDVPERLDAHRLIEEFMILANVAAAETLEQAGSPLVYRVHNEPSFEKMRALGEVLASIGLKLPKQGALKPALFNRILASVEGSEHQTFINEVVLRSQSLSPRRSGAMPICSCTGRSSARRSSAATACRPTSRASSSPKLVRAFPRPSGAQWRPSARPWIA